MKTPLSKTYLTADGRVVSYRWHRVPVVLWLMLVGSILTAFALFVQIALLLVRREPLRPEDDFNVTVFTLILCVVASAVFGLGVYLLVRPEEAGDE
ncbi:MAG: hypothetical protein H7Z72_23305 [Bacteroidetes bacterium]|nr:hypothetical protein [Fibrella sp.]